ncbi:hypothetical protein SDJN02_27370, partial [Cucurbita argyrosperma subsp. argyrosperma]
MYYLEVIKIGTRSNKNKSPTPATPTGASKGLLNVVFIDKLGQVANESSKPPIHGHALPEKDR